MDINELVAELESADVAARRAAAEALSRDGADRAVLALLQASADPDDQVQEWASAALEELGTPPLDVAPQLAAWLTREGPTGYFAATLLGRLGADGAPWSSALGDALGTNPDNSVRQRAAWALGRIGPAAVSATAALEAASQDADARLARLAASALEKLTSAP